MTLSISPNPAPDLRTKSGQYINFPTLSLQHHVLLLRPSWPEDMPEPVIPPIPHGPQGFGLGRHVLTVCDPEGRTVAALRVQPHWQEGLPDFSLAPWPGALASLHTALRYTGLGWLEAGPMALSTLEPEKNPLRAALLWQGMVRLLERNGLGFALGVEGGGTPDADAPIFDFLPQLLEAFGLPDEFAYRPKKFTTPYPQSTLLSPESLDRHLPVGLREAIARGARLTGEPLLDANQTWQFFWVGYHGALLP